MGEMKRSRSEPTLVSSGFVIGIEELTDEVVTAAPVSTSKAYVEYGVMQGTDSQERRRTPMRRGRRSSALVQHGPREITSPGIGWNRFCICHAVNSSLFGIARMGFLTTTPGEASWPPRWPENFALSCTAGLDLLGVPVPNSYGLVALADQDNPGSCGIVHW